jgi:hypothetical protein
MCRIVKQVFFCNVSEEHTFKISSEEWVSFRGSEHHVIIYNK